MDIMTGKNCRQFSLPKWNSFISQFIHPVVGGLMGKGNGWEVSLF